ncbi:MAG: hypothetical protein ABI114_12515 [Rhodanobacter sp.]
MNRGYRLEEPFRRQLWSRPYCPAVLAIFSVVVRLSRYAFSNDDPFDPRRAEARSAIPVWVWVMSLFVVAWAVWYGARMWDVPAPYAKTATYTHAAAAEPAAGR